VCESGREKEKPAGFCGVFVDFNELNAKRIGFPVKRKP
jgi:hypothetical protein